MSEVILTQNKIHGRIPEWPKGTDCKSAANCFDGSNPSPSICRSGGTGRRPGLKIPWVVIPVPVRFRSAALFYSKFLLDLEYFFILYQICTNFSHQKTVPVQEPFRIKPTLFSYFLFFLILFILNTNSLDCYTSSSYYFDIFKVL